MVSGASGEDPVDTDAMRDARARMVRTQLVARGIHDAAVLDAMGRVPRERFVDPALAIHAYDDVALPSAGGQTISQPYMVGLMTEALKLEPGDRVLEVGTGTGYQAAVLATMGASVWTIERLPELSRAAKARLETLGLASRVHFVTADGSLAWPGGDEFDAIVVTAAAPRVPPSLLRALRPGGRLVIPLGDRRHQHLVRVTATAHETITERLVECTFVPLIGLEGWPS